MLADYGQIVPAALLDPPFGALNLHPSLLPRHRGASPIPAAIVAGDRETGVTLMRMDAGLDTGPIVAVERLPLDRVRDGARARGAPRRASPPTCSPGRWSRGCAATCRRRPSPTDGATLTRPLRREDGRLDPSLPATDLERRVRAYLPWPGTFLEADGERLVVGAASVAAIATGRRARPPRARRRPAGVHDDRRTPRARARHAAGPPADVRSGLPAGPPPGPGLIGLVSHSSSAAALASPRPAPVSESTAMEDDATATTTVARPGIGGVTPEDLEAWFTERGHPAYRARQVLDAAWKGRRDRVRGDPDAPGRPAGRARGGVPLRHRGRARGARGRRRPDREGAAHARRRTARRVGPDALPGPRRIARAPHAVHQLAGRLRGRLPVLRDRRARLRPGPRDRRDRRPGPPRRAGCWRPTGSA